VKLPAYELRAFSFRYSWRLRGGTAGKRAAVRAFVRDVKQCYIRGDVV